jgi:DNA integrity scanning protein DisA with diadenylate cyclase activity
MNTINFDGAILIDDYGNILHSGTMIEGLHPRATADKLNPHRTIDLSSQFGFKRKVHMRHITAITSSYFFKDIIVFTISEETNDFHIFKNGKIIYSTVIGEQVR